ncbi:MAG: RecX family transcriptional regulator [Synergistaceae bacterium]|nr:RecX family transcriptional regulator [Synergistaceae bacterium]MBQ3626336.1 RecX family transcriptional regulator [Synergistaceae bacterium]
MTENNNKEFKFKRIEDLLSLPEVKAELERQESEGTRQKFFNFLLRRLVCRKRAELWLREKRVDEDYAEILLEDAESAGLINDLEYAKGFILGHERWDERKIKFELYKRGVSGNDIEDAFYELEQEQELE